MKKVQPWVKIAGIALVAIVAGVILNATGVFKNGNSKGLSLFGGGDVITVGTNTYAGFLPFMYLNNGLEPNEDCILYKEYGLKLKIVIQDDFQAGRIAFKNGNIDIIYCTADALPVEMGENSEMSEARFFNISNWSRGADALVVNKNIMKVSDLVGKVIACSEGTASHTLLLNTLETSGIGYDKVNLSSTIDPKKVNIKVVSDGLAAAQVFKSGQCDGAVVYSPDDQDIVQAGIGKVLVSTKQASSIICDGLIAKQSYLEKNKDKVQKLISALLMANVKMNTDPTAVQQAAKAFAKSYDTDEEFAIAGSKNIHYVTLEDEANFFGLRSSYTGVKGEELYSKMARTYEGLGLCKHPVSWNKASTTAIIEGLMEDPTSVKGDQSAEKQKTFSAPTEKLEEAAAISNKSVTIEFATGSDILDNNAKSIIDREFKLLVKQFSNSRIRIEGNTDNTGSDEINKPLSQRRAKAVADYLISECNCDPNRFVIVGNGSAHAKAAGSIGPDQTYRTTDFKLINE